MGWLTGWGYRKSHEIDGSTFGAQTDYQVKVIVHKGAGADAGEDVYLGDHVQDDFGDVRFTSEDEETELDYWMESYVSGDHAVFWVEIPSIPADPDKAIIYIYYGKVDATTSDGEATFPFFDDFDDDVIDPNKWTIEHESGPGFTETGGYLSCQSAGGDDSRITTRGHFTFDFTLVLRINSEVLRVAAGPYNSFQNGLSDAPGGAPSHGFYYCRPVQREMGYFDCTNAQIGAYIPAGDILGFREFEGVYWSSFIQWWRDGVKKRENAIACTPADWYIHLRHWGGYPEGRIDFIFVRRFVDPEPSHGAWGEEETSPVPPPPPGPPQIDLRLTDVDPPDREPPRTIYRDLLNLPDPLVLGVTIRYFNFDEIGLYFRVTGKGVGYTFGTVDLGLLGSGTNAYRNLDNFGSRSKPGAETTEAINLILRAYTDAGYTNLRWTYTRTVTIIYIDSSDPSYTVDELDNFDDGTIMGWAATHEWENTVATVLAVAQDYVLSPPFSLKLDFRGPGGVLCTPVTKEIRERLYKSFTTPDKNLVYLIADIRIAKGGHYPQYSYPKYWATDKDDERLIFIGRSYDTVTEIYIPLDKWMRVVAPLPKNETFDVRFRFDILSKHVTAGLYVWLDDFKIISKD